MKEANEYYASSVVACGVLGVIILAIAGIAISKLELLLNIPETLVKSVKILFIVVFLNFFVVTFSTPFSSSAYIKNRLDITGIVKVAAKILDAIIVIVLFVLFPANVWFVAIGTLCASIITMISNVVLTKKLTPELVFKKKLASLAKVKDLAKNGVWNSLNQIGNVLNSGLDLVISNLMLTGIETGEIAIAKTIEAIFATLFQTISQPFQPALIRSYAKGDMDDFLREMSKAMRICGFFGAVSFAGFFALGKQYYSLWLPSQNATMLHTLTMITIFNYITDSILRPVYYVNTLTLKNKTPCFVTIAGGFLNVASMYFLLKYTDAIVTWYQKFKESVFFRKLFFLAFVTSLILFRTLLNRQLWMNPLSDVMGGWGIWETVNGEQKLTTECIENVIMMVPFSAIVMWTFGKKIGNSWKKILCYSGKIAFIFSVSIEMLQLLLRLGTFQLSDIFYNTVGGLLGGLMYCAVMKARKHL